MLEFSKPGTTVADLDRMRFKGLRAQAALDLLVQEMGRDVPIAAVHWGKEGAEHPEEIVYFDSNEVAGCVYTGHGFHNSYRVVGKIHGEELRQRIQEDAEDETLFG